MVLKNRYSYRWRLFVPIVVMMWSVIALLMGYQYYREVQHRRDNVRTFLAIVNGRVLSAYDKGIDMSTYVSIFDDFFQDAHLKTVRVSIYDADGLKQNQQPKLHIGKPLMLDDVEMCYAMEHNATPVYDEKTATYYKCNRSSDGKLYVFTAMPMTVSLSESLDAVDLSFWIILVALLGGATVMTYLATTSLTRSIKILRKFAQDANKGNAQIEGIKFPDNELGDISRAIMRLYRDRSEAFARSEREHDMAINAIEEKSRLRRQLTNNINHEIKTPVGIIKGYLETVLTTKDLDEDLRMRFLTRAHENVDRLCELLGSVSTMTRLDEDGANIAMMSVDVHEVAFAVDNDFTTSGLKGDMAFKYDIPVNCQVLANYSLLTSVLSNLIENAVAHSQGTLLELLIVGESEGYYTFSFRDNGVGVGEKHIPHLFDRFYRVDNGRTRKTGGTGLGLPIVKKIIDTMGGSISVHNRSTGGLEFVFTLKKFS